MKKTIKRRTEISVETHEIKIIRISSEGNSVFCPHCRTMVSSFTPAQIARCLSISVADVDLEMKTGKLHSTGAGTGAELVCGNSIQCKKN